MAIAHKTVQQRPSVGTKTPSAWSSASFKPSKPPRARAPARSVGTFIPKLTRTAFEKFGFSTVALLTDWEKIVGAKLAASTSPDRIVWPRPVSDLRNDSASSSPRKGATLHLSVHPAQALDVQYKSALIIDRINAYFGYSAVSALRVVQVAHSRHDANSTRAPLPIANPAHTMNDPVMASIADERLRSALQTLQQGMAARAAAR